MPPLISVIIPAHNRKEELARVLEALQKQTVKEREIIVVDDSVPPIELRASERVPAAAASQVRYFHIPPTTHTRARNFGIRQANGSIVAFTDDDCIPSPDWLEKMAFHFEDPSVAGVEGRTVAEKMKVNFHATENLKGGCYPTCNLAFRKPVLEQTGFDEKYGFFREDTDLAFSVLSTGKKIIFAEDVVVAHPPRRTPAYAPLRELKMIKSDIRLYRKFPDLYREKIGFVGGGGVKIAALVWLFTILSLVFSPLFIVFVLLLKYQTHLRRRIFSFGWGLYIIFSWARDLLYPFSFVFYYVTERGR